MAIFFDFIQACNKFLQESIEREKTPNQELTQEYDNLISEYQKIIQSCKEQDPKYYNKILNYFDLEYPLQIKPNSRSEYKACIDFIKEALSMIQKAKREHEKELKYGKSSKITYADIVDMLSSIKK